jgi:hypothetical protein
MEPNKINDVVTEALALSAKAKDKAQVQPISEVKTTKASTPKASA